MAGSRQKWQEGDGVALTLYANAKAQNPERWSGKTRNWQPAGPVWLNPETDMSVPEIRDAA